MKVKNLKTRIAAFGLAVLMGVSTLSSANAFAAEQTDVGAGGTGIRTGGYESERKAVTADDITKEISDETFAVETSMEGIHYDAEKRMLRLSASKMKRVGNTIRTKPELTLPLTWLYQRIRVTATSSAER